MPCIGGVMFTVEELQELKKQAQFGLSVRHDPSPHAAVGVGSTWLGPDAGYAVGVRTVCQDCARNTDAATCSGGCCDGPIPSTVDLGPEAEICQGTWDCCVRGVVGRHDGELVFCECIEGLKAHMNHLANLLQDHAQVLAQVDATRDPPRYLVGVRETVAAAFDQYVREYDALEAEWARRKDKGE